MRKLVLLAMFAGCSTSPPEDTYHVRIDLRDCVSPICGGAWVRAADGHQLACSSQVTNGSECYVGSLSAEPSDLLSQIADHPVQGRFESGIAFDGKDWGTFVVTSIE